MMNSKVDERPEKRADGGGRRLVRVGVRFVILVAVVPLTVGIVIEAAGLMHGLIEMSVGEASASFAGGGVLAWLIMFLRDRYGDFVLEVPNKAREFYKSIFEPSWGEFWKKFRVLNGSVFIAAFSAVLGISYVATEVPHLVDDARDQVTREGLKEAIAELATKRDLETFAEAIDLTKALNDQEYTKKRAKLLDRLEGLSAGL